MTHLIIYAHPNEQSFNHAILDKVIASSGNHKVIVRDLNTLAFQPVLNWQEALDSFNGKIAEEITQEHQYWQEAECITLIYPLWWMGFPAILKGYLDRVLTYGFAYTNGEIESIGLLNGKKLQQFVTLGNSNEKYESLGFLQSLDDTLGNGLFNFCGIEEVQMHFLGSIGAPSTNYLDLLEAVEKNTQALLKA